ncbi:hypothetical protein RFI_16552, partial [Reticulomyxa filosa]
NNNNNNNNGNDKKNNTNKSDNDKTTDQMSKANFIVSIPTEVDMNRKGRKVLFKASTQAQCSDESTDNELLQSDQIMIRVPQDNCIDKQENGTNHDKDFSVQHGPKMHERLSVLSKADLSQQIIIANPNEVFFYCYFFFFLNIIINQSINQSNKQINKKALIGQDWDICWDFFSILGCHRGALCLWRHEIPLNQNVIFQAIPLEKQMNKRASKDVRSSSNGKEVTKPPIATIGFLQQIMQKQRSDTLSNNNQNLAQLDAQMLQLLKHTETSQNTIATTDQSTFAESNLLSLSNNHYEPLKPSSLSTTLSLQFIHSVCSFVI